MVLKRFVLAVLVTATLDSSARAQDEFTDHRPRLLLNGEIGNQVYLGYKFPSTAVGPSIEIPIKDRFEFQSSASYSPDRKAITDDGQSLKLSGSAIGFANPRLGFIASIAHTSLWTSQFDKSGWLPSAGVVVRNDYWGQGRLYISYVFPTGCVWATSTNPCTIQSNRLQGIQLRQDTRNGAYKRWGYEAGIYHFCDQSNPNEPQTGRKCHWAGTIMFTFSLESHLGRLTRYALNGDRSDNF